MQNVCMHSTWSQAIQHFASWQAFDLMHAQTPGWLPLPLYLTRVCPQPLNTAYNFITLSNTRWDAVKTRTNLAAIGVGCVALSAAAGYGISSAIGLPFTVLVEASCYKVLV